MNPFTEHTQAQGLSYPEYWFFAWEYHDVY